MDEIERDDQLERQLLRQAGDVFEEARERALSKGHVVMFAEDGVIYQESLGQSPIEVEKIELPGPLGHGRTTALR